MKSLKDKSLASLIKEADTVFSKYIRQKYSTCGYCQCFICDAKLKISEAQNGHYIDRNQMPTRYDEMNCRPVCEACNCYDTNHIQKFRIRLIYTIGSGQVEHLHVKARSLAKFMRHELQEIIDSYKQKIKEL